MYLVLYWKTSKKWVTKIFFCSVMVVYGRVQINMTLWLTVAQESLDVIKSNQAVHTVALPCELYLQINTGITWDISLTPLRSENTPDWFSQLETAGHHHSVSLAETEYRVNFSFLPTLNIMYAKWQFRWCTYSMCGNFSIRT